MDPARDAKPQADPERSFWLNVTGRYVLERCDGARSVAELARQLADAWDVTEQRARTDLLPFLEHMRQHGLVQVDEQ